jgi:hypothetical protein
MAPPTNEAEQLRPSRWKGNGTSSTFSPNQALHHDRGRILVSRDTTPLQRPGG